MIDEFIGKTLAGKYEIEELLRESEFGNTYRATHLMMENPVTIKILSPTLAVDENIVERFSVEARTISRLSHPNILNVTDFGKDEETVFIVTEYAEGKTLNEVVKVEGGFPIERAVRITRQIAAALSSAHASNIIHQNLTSDRVQLVPMGNDTELVKVLDIGSFEVDNTRDYEDGESFDDLAYLSPEQCTQESEADERSDIYSLGVIFYQMLTGGVPFDADTATDLMMKHSQSPPPPLVAFREDIPEEIEPILLNALAKNPDKRYQSAAAFADDLSEAIRIEDEDDTIVIPKVNAAAASTGAANNNVWKTAFIVLAGISILAFSFIMFTNTERTEPATIVKTDENGKPVQPLNSATGLSEQNLPNMDQFPSNSLTNLDPNSMPPSVGGITEGGYSNPWDNGPPSAGSPILEPGGETITMGDGSIFMRNPDGDGSTVILVPKPIAEDTEETKNVGDKKTDKVDDKKTTDANDKKKDEGTVKPKDGVDKKVEDKKATDKKEVKPPKKENKKPVEKPVEKNNNTGKPSSNNRKIRSGVEQDT